MFALQKEIDPGDYPASVMFITDGDQRHPVTVEERDVPVPLISLTLRHHYSLTLPMDGGERYGWQMGATLSCICTRECACIGKGRQIHGIVVPLLHGPDIVVPLGFLTGRGPH